MNQFLIKLVKLYQIHLSARLARQCCFMPSCSQYAILAFQKHNIIKAIALICQRLHRCSRFKKGTFSYFDYP